MVMGGLELAMLVIVGFAVALAVWFLIDALPVGAPGFDAPMLQRLGLLFAGVVFAMTGPVLVAREAFLRPQAAVRLIALVLALVWAWALGAVVSGLVPVTF